MQRNCRQCGLPLPPNAHPLTQLHKECIPASQRAWEKENHQKVLDYKAKTHRKLREEVLAAYGGACACCGETTYEFLAIDHYEVSGKEHREKVGREVYRDLRQRGFPPGYRVLCHNCNLAIGFYGYCQHNR